MKNLENYGVQELNQNETTGLNGGFVIALSAAACWWIAGGIATAVVAAGAYVGYQDAAAKNN